MVSLRILVFLFIAYRGGSLKLSSLPPQAFSPLGSFEICRVIVGTWAASRSGLEDRDLVARFSEIAANGFTTFDTADVQNRAETVLGKMNRGRYFTPTSRECQYLSQWTPFPKEIDKKAVTESVDRTLARTNRDFVDLLQLHWWDYDNFYYFNAIGHLMELREEGKIREIGVSNFNAEYLGYLLEENAPIVSNQVSFSVLDFRAKERLIPLCEDKNVSLLCHGTLLGGFISPKWLGKTEPSLSSLETGSNEAMRKYLTWIHVWGGWELFQELLRTLDLIARKHHVSSLSVVAMRWVLQQSKAIGGIIVGSRFAGRCDDFAVLSELFSFSLDDEDLQRIDAVQRKGHAGGKSLVQKCGDCGDEFRRPSKLKRRKYMPTII